MPLKLEHFLVDRLIAECAVETARWYGYIDATTRAKAKQLPVNDVWIAALAIQNNAVLVTRDAHFGYVERLLVSSG
jgi:tRNA(fMet)-specific endonuclease VapC